MFPEYRDRISKLKIKDAHFARLFHKHNDLDQQIKNLECARTNGKESLITGLKKEKLLLKDQLYSILRRSTAH
ncbi:YdcH family protein [Paraburkholderia sp. HP33-1]|uniref:YdcH family protein n=1 Tax=Paraburkholderia sp. HP33-1 TaxID=2883243 RepID=UPI001F28CF3D|nr:YdcH family protein [Paraburkholderia sp. HP33-1]